jgi:DNA mismatch endonuclease (patch repair protein)
LPDKFPKEKRSQIMSRIRSKDTSLDLAMFDLLDKAGLAVTRYPKIYGKPDFLVLPNAVIFCDSSFWHGRNWRLLKNKLISGNNPEYWVQHISKNRIRDRLVTKMLTREGYIVLRFWDRDISKNPDKCLQEIKKHLSLVHHQF